MELKSNKILFSAEIGGGDLKAIEGIAYGGGEVRQPWSDFPIVIDLRGMRFADQIPLMYNHINDPEYRLGIVDASTDGNTLAVKGGIDVTTKRGNAIAEMGRKVNWQLSIGAEIKNLKFIEDGGEVINGRKVRGGIYAVTESELREVSVVAIGADSETSLQIACGWNCENETKTNNNISNGESTMEEDLKKTECGECGETEKVVSEIPQEVKQEIPDGDILEEVTEEVAEEIEEKNEKETLNKGEEEMAEELKKAVAEERERVACAMSELKDAPADVLDKAIKAGWSSEKIRETASVIKSVRSGMGSTANIIVKSEKQMDSNAIEASIAMRCGMSGDTVAKTYGEETAELAYKNRRMSALDYVRASLRNAGHNVSGSIHDEIVAGFQVTDLPKILSNVANKALLKSFEVQDVAAKKLGVITELPDYKLAYRARLADVGGLQSVPEGGEVPQTQMGEDYAQNQVERFAEVFWIDEKLIINDDLGALQRIPQIIGSKAATFLDSKFFGILNSNGNFVDGTALFHTNHKNLAGSGTALSLDSLKAAYCAMAAQKDKGGTPINVHPKFLVVPAALYATALDITKSQYVVGGNSKAPAANFAITSWNLEVVCSPYLDATSTTAWYLFGDPAQVDTIEVAFLRGQQTPVVEQGTFDLNRFGIGYRVRYDFGVAPLDYRAMYKNLGA